MSLARVTARLLGNVITIYGRTFDDGVSGSYRVVAPDGFEIAMNAWNVQTYQIIALVEARAAAAAWGDRYYVDERLNQWPF